MVFLITWKPKLQSNINLSTAEAKCITLSTTLHKVTPMIEILRDISALTDAAESIKTMKFFVL